MRTRKLQKQLEDLWSSYYPHLVAFILLVVLVSLPNLNNPTIFDPKTPLLFADSSKSFSDSAVTNHNIILRDALESDKVMEMTVLSSQENTRTQTRMFYVTILAAIVAFLISDKALVPWVPKAIILFLVDSLYILEVQQGYVNQKSRDTYHIRSKNLERLVNLTPDDRVWYVYSCDSLARLDSSKSAERWSIRAYRAWHPSWEHRIVYLLPFIAALLFRMNDLRPGRNRQDLAGN